MLFVFLGHSLFGLVSFWGEGTSPPHDSLPKKTSVSVWSCRSAWLHVASEPICFRIDYSPAGPGGTEYCCVILSYICSKLLSPFHCQMDDLCERKPQFLIQMSSIIIHMSTYFCMSLEQKHQSPSSEQCLWKDPTLSDKKYEITSSNTTRGIPPQNQHATQKWRLGRCSSFSKGCFSGSMLIFGRVYN